VNLPFIAWETLRKRVALYHVLQTNMNLYLVLLQPTGFVLPVLNTPRATESSQHVILDHLTLYLVQPRELYVKNALLGRIQQFLEFHHTHHALYVHRMPTH
jgi:hypothetical protein